MEVRCNRCSDRVEQFQCRHVLVTYSIDHVVVELTDQRDPRLNLVGEVLGSLILINGLQHFILTWISTT